MARLAVAGENRWKLRPATIGGDCIAGATCKTTRKATVQHQKRRQAKSKHIVYNALLFLFLFFIIWESRVLQFLLQKLLLLCLAMFLFFFQFLLDLLLFFHSLLPIFTSVWVVWHFLTAVSQSVKVAVEARSQQNKNKNKTKVACPTAQPLGDFSCFS